jgi:DNA-binding NarL/FixJ family response regulator
MINDQVIKVSIVEDNDDIRDALRALIKGSQGFECVHVYPDAETAIEDMPAREIDVVLMDINLPGMNGIECMRQVKDKMPQTQFMMCTVYDDDEDIFSALESGATGYLLKRTSPAQILEAIRDLYNGGSPMSSEIARRVVASVQKRKKLSEPVEALTIRENEILEFLAKGFLYKEIAEKLFISHETVKRHIHNIYDKLHVQSRIEAVNKAFQR